MLAIRCCDRFTPSGLCDLEVVDAAFATDAVPTEPELRAALSIGSVAPARMLGSGYTLCTRALTPYWTVSPVFLSRMPPPHTPCTLLSLVAMRMGC